MKKISSLHKYWMKEPAYRKEYETIEEEFALASAIIAARSRAGLAQEQLSQRMENTQSTIARFERGRTVPSARTLKRFADATASKLKISFEPSRKARKADG
jgi:ribosome-binding protein aMBF1 (putative translation factor)